MRIQIRIQEHGNKPKSTNKPDFLPPKKAFVGTFVGMFLGQFTYKVYPVFVM
jgi:hypothetical protein